MAREIKFRAWSKTGEYFLPIQEDPDYMFFHIDDGLEVWENGRRCEAVLLQYTGLKDKNGKEIYEGDIVNAIENGIDQNFFKTDEVFSERVAEVYWDELFAGWGLRAETFERGCEPMTHLDSFEVIGNIYENANLLQPC